VNAIDRTLTDGEPRAVHGVFEPRGQGPTLGYYCGRCRQTFTSVLRAGESPCVEPAELPWWRTRKRP
jgi:hypothetical protein